MKPAFWSDAKVAALPEATRLFYIGLWMVADDAGWFRWDAAEVSRDLYGYEGRAKRERRASAMFDALAAIGRVIGYPCGHAEVPRLGDHQHLAGTAKQVRGSFNEHLRACVSPSPAETRGDPPTPANPRNGNGKEKVMVRNGQVSEGKVGARASADALALRDADDEAELRKLRAVG